MPTEGYKEEGFLNQIGLVMPYDVKKHLEKDPMTSLLYITDIGYYPNAEKHYMARKEGAHQHILIYCTKGSGRYTIEGQRHHVKSGEFFVIEAGRPHSYAASENDPWSIYWIHFMGSQSDLFSPMFNRTTGIPERYNMRDEERIRLFEDIFRNLERGYTEDNLRYSSLCLWHLLGSFQHIRQFNEIATAKTLDVVQQSINYMKVNLDKRLALKDFAGNAGYSPSHFGKLFAARTDQTPLDYFNQLKIQAACQYLVFSSLKIKEIAWKLGFYDQYHFSKVFFRYMNSTPSMYRNSRR